MGKNRNINTDFWKHAKVMDEYSVEDKYFLLYLYTCPNSEMLGMYKLPLKIISFETGYTTEMIKILLDRFENSYKIIVYDFDSQEILIKNYIKHTIIKGGKPILDAFIAAWNNIKSISLKKQFLKENIKVENNNKTLNSFLDVVKSNFPDYVNDLDKVYDNDYVYDYVLNVPVSYDDTQNSLGVVSIKKLKEKHDNKIIKM